MYLLCFTINACKDGVFFFLPPPPPTGDNTPKVKHRG